MRLIPAHAGKTPPQCRARERFPAHPRSRGENGISAWRISETGGSSPLTRGKRLAAGVVPHIVRLIPAHAGKTPSRMISPGSLAAHPRSRGENAPDELAADFLRGSSPLTRGKPSTPCWTPNSSRLIPAHAGKTSRRRALSISRPAHPRSRGENITVSTGWEIIEGSSPLTRGKPTGLMSSVPSQGLIPAHAGKTRRLTRRR